ncbi:excalibur calcium-binding domain-containing protein [Pimelobacter simplex]|uniref:Excalibur calcium-binding domain-containing protein n=1 Tax=Nocardioides simplex TaxID=2045 RepID=A0A0A1DRP9_NOCSI|nr:excalibur calcium-binding domain-containing protein [Pimelobacter simplex]AIY18040.1 Excalibur domain protein [Pimelobacter simplex]KAB2810730.1 excalibur calcium-binding domain-containing protein [Pimelobacter simplex]MCG8153626.1 calcium-binding protein [Pimelobacter simplex]SFN07995.1 Excalibur calcium-binding domain-containing protein [Pimelobacter simplex]GEB17099.1 hypothetical protein NSI01_54140 [Pimelobacter simplex]
MTPRRIASAVAVLALTAPVATTLAAAPASASAGTGKYYSSCAKLTRVFPHGVSKSRAAAMKQVREGYGAPAYGKKARETYARNKSRLDRDGDGTACER